MARPLASTLVGIALTLGASALPTEGNTETFGATADAYITEYEIDLVTAAADLHADVLNTCHASGNGHCDRDEDGYVRSIPLVQFDLSSIPPTSTITSCELRLECWYLDYADHSNPRALGIDAFRVTSPWTEAVSWSTRPSWTEDVGASAAVDRVGPVVIDGPALADIVQMWVDGAAPNYGLLLWPGDDIHSYAVKLYSKETAPSGPDGPQLTVGYAPPPAGSVVEAWRLERFGAPVALSVSTIDDSCWVADESGNEVVHLAADGTELWRGGGFDRPQGISVDSTDGSCWVADSGNGAVVRLAPDGAELLRIPGFVWPAAVAVNPADGSCWVADGQEGLPGAALVHLAEGGTELARISDLCSRSLSVNPVDGSLWSSDNLNADVVHVAEDRTELWRGAIDSRSVSVNPTDGSCWVSDSGQRQVAHLHEEGAEAWRGGSISWEAAPVSVNSADGSCWVGDSTDAVRLAEDGTEAGRAGGFRMPRAVAVNVMDGSCWVADTGHGEVVRLLVVGYRGPRFPDILPYHWAYEEIEACCGAGIVGGYPEGLYRPTKDVSRDQMAVFISRSICTPTGEAGLADYTPPGTASFSDVPTDYWAYKHIEYAVEHSIVQGYGDGAYHPEYTLDRGQMAVFIARALCGGEEGVPDPECTAAPFPDVGCDVWSRKHIQHILSAGVAKGYPDGLYHPEYSCSRDQMAVYIARAFNRPL